MTEQERQFNFYKDEIKHLEDEKNKVSERYKRHLYWYIDEIKQLEEEKREIFEKYRETLKYLNNETLRIEAIIVELERQLGKTR